MSQTLGGTSRSGRILGPSLDKIIKNVAWRKHSQLVSSCKSALDKLETLTDSSDFDTSLLGFSPPDSEFVLQPLILAIDSASIKIVEPALECLLKLFSLGLIRGEIDGNENHSVEFRLIESACKCGGLNDEGIELALLKVLISSVRSPCVLIRADCLNQIIRTCYNVYFGSQSGTNQICAKAVLAQILTIVFARVEEDSMEVKVRPVSVSDLLELSDKSLNDPNLIQFVQNFINEVMEGSEGVPVLKPVKQLSVELQNGNVSGSNEDGKVETKETQESEGVEQQQTDSKIREDGFLLFRNLCKLSMKFSAHDNPEDPYLLRGKVLSLELLKVMMENSGPIWRTNDSDLSSTAPCLSQLKAITKNQVGQAEIVFRLYASFSIRRKTSVGSCVCYAVDKDVKVKISKLAWIKHVKCSSIAN